MDTLDEDSDYICECESECENTFTITGGKSQTHYVGIENVKYYYALRIEELRSIKSKLASTKTLSFERHKTVYDVYKYVIDTSSMAERLYEQIEKTVTCLRDIDENLSMFLLICIRRFGSNTKLCISIPETHITVSACVKYDPVVLYDTVSSICEHINKIQIGDLADKTKLNISKMSNFKKFETKHTIPHMSTEIQSIDIDLFDKRRAGEEILEYIIEKYSDNSEYILFAKIFAVELSFERYLLDLEKYQLGAINILNTVFDICSAMKSATIKQI